MTQPATTEEDKETSTEVAVSPLEMSDEDFLKQAGPPASEPTSATTEEATTSEGDKTNETDGVGATGSAGSDTDGTDTGATTDTGAKVEDKVPAKEEPKDGKTDQAGTDDKDKDKPKTDVDGEIKDKETGAAVTQQFQVPSTFKANGKDIELKSPEEAIKLMQMGANYTRKLQELAPHRKILMMLQDNGLDEDKLSYLIDLDKGNPEAIKKLIKDTGIDPLEIDTNVEPKYLGGSHAPTDEEANFRNAVSELSADPQGKETLVLINTKWDNASKDVLWASPEIMSVINEQRSNGIYDAITAEMDRRITLGQIPPNTPFLQAYTQIGDELAKAHSATNNADGTVQTEPKVIDTRAAAPKSTVKNDDRVSAASPTRSTPNKATETVNPLSMSDDDFLKSMDKRL